MTHIFSETYKDWTILPFPSPTGGYMAAIYRPGVVPVAHGEADMTWLCDTKEQAVNSAKAKIDILARQNAETAPQGEGAPLFTQANGYLVFKGEQYMFAWFGSSPEGQARAQQQADWLNEKFKDLTHAAAA